MCLITNYNENQFANTTIIPKMLITKEYNISLDNYLAALFLNVLMGYK